MVESISAKSFNFGPLFIFTAALLWTTDVFVRSSFEDDLTSTQVVLLEHVIIILIMSPLVIKYAPKLLELNRNEWISVLIIGIGGSALATIALTEGFFLGDFQYQYAVQVVFLQQLQPIVAIGLAHVLLKEKLPAYYYVLSITAIIGAFLLVFADDQVNLINGKNFKLNDLDTFFDNLTVGDGLQAGLLGLTAAALWGASTVFGRYMLEYGEQRPDYFQMTTYRFTIALVFLIFFIPFYSRSDGYPINRSDGFSKIDSFDTFAGLLYIAIIVGLLSLILYYFGLKSTQASVSTIFELAFPLSFYVIVPFLDENVRPNFVQQVGSVILIISATILLLLNNSLKMDETQDESKTMTV
ncbi:MAG: DMT family transporter [Candidatus Kariarchaeaceae archaeon]|jgi:drug/metabolite transporter (DMT)-like permease